MKTYLDCIPCAIRQVLDSVRMITDDEAAHEVRNDDDEKVSSVGKIA